ncbi:glycosyltransferase family 4 protein [Microcoleus sp. FACHB-1515]|uniref:glycosyltransferase family 4 protein n=1 Tax=Cyanophyceae TaxID=3028117 RepID=UPI0016858044|nr:glycosyltransferase family 4 protein [Microcoleus sp. FACHB-1515]MBD2089673.1 glycosyltransferase family 4 protein [Microcoleus sp. FACHB-1515]
MRILIYSYNYHPEPIGIAPLMTELAEGLAARGHQVRVITGMPNYPERRIYPAYRGKWYDTEIRNGVKIQRSYVWIRPKPNLLTRILLDGSFVVTSLLQALRGWRPDVILYTAPPLPVCVPCVLLSWLYGCPIVLNLQDILPEAAIRLGLVRNKLAIRVFQALEKFAYRSANQICVIAEAFRENLLTKGVPAEKLVCIPNWVNTDFICALPRQNAFRQAHDLQNKFVVMYSGNIGLTQGLETVVRAAAKLCHLPEIVFVIVGETEALAQLRSICETYDAPNVRLLPFQPRSRLPEMLAAADVGLIVQKRNVVSFNMPSKMQLILASSRPIIASVPLDGTAARAVLESGGGMVIEPEQPDRLAEIVLQLYRDPQRAQRLGQQGRRHAIDCYDFEQALSQYESLFAQLSGQPGAARIESPAVDQAAVADLKQ